MSLALVKVIGLICAASSYYVSVTPPLPRAGPEDKVFKTQSFERIVFALSLLTRTLFILAMLSEVIVTATIGFPRTSDGIPHYAYAALCPRPQEGVEELQRVSLLFALGVVLSAVGASIRAWTYRVLGQFYLYEVAIRSNHSLVTRAPYNIVRHPSYAGLYMSIIGMLTMLYSQSNWGRVCGLSYTAFGPLLSLWAVFWSSVSVYTFISLWGRCVLEDKILHQKFGDSWSDYRRNVAYRLIPGVV
ncbi:hypothetical protein K488DRAFT_57028 [Vararia minispora EC-137]|uniref:Uncharacterized protein n=1 Tax=Vararia minispora EC-137 TaxID=1314806 RepID=A0ACB8QBZ2_9AGAM|nr:hypothetical protein K488DRAFT_57028 [Vararia minispora EC-137]